MYNNNNIILEVANLQFTIIYNFYREVAPHVTMYIAIKYEESRYDYILHFMG
jgi:hypothetical protein